MPEPAQVFEHDSLAVGEQGLTSRHFDALVRYNERHSCTLFRVGHHRLHFGSFVGVIQVGRLTIEILPKAERGNSKDKGKWQNALLQMLRQSGLLDVESAPEAKLRLHRSPLIDLYLDSFLTEVERIVHAGLTKKYRVCEGNLNKLKGRILFRQQISRNLIHRERMFTAHQTYDSDNLFNRILKSGVGIVRRLAVRQSLTARAGALELSFEQVSNTRITMESFERARLDRNTQGYQKALQLARLIILNYSPDLRGGLENIVAILFDMNLLFERFILVRINRDKHLYGHRHLTIRGQLSKVFWARKTIRPDVVADFQDESGLHRVILDTKWKLPKNGLPADEDLKQMFTYNVHLGARQSVLVYPRAELSQNGINARYAQSSSLPANKPHGCATHYVELFDGRNLRKDIGKTLINEVILGSEQDPAN